jgi:hypothetical protein
MTLMLDKTHSLVKPHLSTICFPSVGTENPLTDIVLSYLPKAFETLTRGLNKRGLKTLIIDTVPQLDPKCAGLICTYLDNAQTLLYLLDQLIDRETTIDNLMRRIEGCEWDDPIFQQPNIDQYFLDAVRQGRLTDFEFASLCLTQTAQKQWNSIPLRMPIVDKGGINSTTLALVDETLELFFDPPVPLLSPSQRETFLSEVQKLSPLDSLISFQPLLLLSEKNILRAIQSVGLNLFGEVSLEITVTSSFWKTQTTVSESMMITPLGFIQAFLRAKFGTDAIDLLPVIGPTGVSELRDNGIDGTRVVSLGHSFLEQLTAVRLPLEADGLDAPGIYFSYHDSSYHSYLSSSVSHPLRQRFVQFHDIMKKGRKELVINENESMDAFFRKVGFDFIDMEHTAFRPDYDDDRLGSRSTSTGLFWRSVAFILQKHSKKVPHGLFEDCTIRLSQFLTRHNLLTSEDITLIHSEQKRAKTLDEEKPLVIVFEYLLKGISG